MNYSKSKAEKLVTEFDYLKTKPYFPYGKEGKEFKITELKAVPETIKKRVENFSKPESYFEQKNKELAQGYNWFVKVTISDNETIIEKDLKDVLSRLKIQNDIDDIPN
ncbi:hypothetical protein [Yeosuana sp.]|uniref:hypothetical protein n=1 Tax=Yeosuana sp. TaxID=2529388 RepID=UPI0040550DBC